jgi:hypothetical protein
MSAVTRLEVTYSKYWPPQALFSIQQIPRWSVQAVKFVKVIRNVGGSILGWDTDEPERVFVVSFSPKTQNPKTIKSTRH